MKQPEEYISIHTLSKEKLTELGITQQTIDLLQSANIDLENLYYNEMNWAFPIVYFDHSLEFEFHFSSFQQDWSDRSQLQRFSTLMQLHKGKVAKSEHLLN